MTALSSHQVRQAAGQAFRHHQRAHAPASIPRRIPAYRIGSPAARPAPVDVTPPSIEERLCAAAHRILSDGRQHSLEAQAWALQLLERSTPGSTAFIRAARRLTFAGALAC